MKKEIIFNLRLSQAEEVRLIKLAFDLELSRAEVLRNGMRIMERIVKSRTDQNYNPEIILEELDRMAGE